jgi:uncharacterized protein
MSRTIWACLVLGPLLAPLGCGTVGPSTRAEKPTTGGGFRGQSCEPDLILECEEVCKAGAWSACEIAGLGYLHGEHVTQDLRRAGILLRRSCEQDRPLACSAYAKMALDQQGPSLEGAVIRQHLEAGCNADDFNACVRRGNLWLADAKDAGNLQYATPLWERGCTGGEAEGCFQLGVNAKTGRGGTPKNTAKATELLSTGCQGMIGEACYELAQLQLTGDKQATDITQSDLNHQRACSLGFQPACTIVANAYREGTGVAQDLSKARLLHGRACLASQIASCVALAEMSSDNPKEQLRLFTKGCDAKIASACFQQAQILEAQQPSQVADGSAIKAAYQVACEKGVVKACGRLGLLLSMASPPKAPGEIARLLGKGCDTGSMPEACLTLGQWLAKGELIPRDGARAAQLLGPLCAQGTGTACFALGRLTQFGYGVPANALGASSLYASGCEAGDKPSCLAHAEQSWLGIGGVKKTPSAAVTTFRTQCDEKVTEACVALGYALQQGVGVPRDLERARQLFDSECKAGRQLGCAYLGNLLAASRGTDREKGQRQLTSACDSATGKACWFLAGLGSPSPATRSEFLKRACALEVPEACAVLQLRP